MNKGVLIILALAVVIGTGLFLTSNKRTETQSPQPETEQEMPITNPLVFQGVLPCADCSGLDTTLTVRPDKTYTLSEVYQGKNDDDPFVTNGTWEVETGSPQDPKATIYALRSGSGNMTYYLIKSDTEIVTLDQDKNPIDAPFNTSLTLKK